VKARDIMTREVVSVSPETPTAQIAAALLQHGISAVPVIDASGAVVGMVSEGDLLGRNDAEREARRDWWLALVAEGEDLNPDFLASLKQKSLTARDVMSAPVVAVAEDAEIAEISRLLATHRIKRVPVVADGGLVGVVSRADLLRALTAEHQDHGEPNHVSRARRLMADALTALDHHFALRHQTPAPAGASSAGGAQAERVGAADFRSLSNEFRRQQMAQHDRDSVAAAEGERQRVRELIDHHIVDERWSALLHQARVAAEHGAKEFMLLRFPSDLCTDQGRAINSGRAEWPKTLRGEAAELYLLWERDLKPRGFRLASRVLEFPAGRPGDIGLFLIWGE
jgi:CBS-domain-containing membrane protein